MKKTVLSVLVLLTLLLLFTGCGKEEAEAPHDPDEWLTCVFRGEPLELPAGWIADTAMQPYADPKSGEITVLVRADLPAGETADDRFALCSVSQDGKTELIPLTLSERWNICNGAMSPAKDCLYLHILDWDAEAQKAEEFFVRYDLAKRESVRSFPIEELPGRNSDPMSNSVMSVTTDGNGRCFAALYRELLILNDSMQLVQTLPIPAGNNIESVSAAPDGTVWVNVNDGESILYPVAPGESAFGTGTRLPERANRVFFVKGHDLCCSTSDGLFALDEADGSGESAAVTPILLYENSALDGQYTRLCAVIDEETVMLSLTDPVTYVPTFALYRHAEDVNLANLVTLEIAYGSENLLMQTNLASVMAQYNRQHPDVRVILTDCTDGSYRGGEETLLREIGLGERSPDLVMTMSASQLAMGMRENKLYTDLSAYLAADPALSDDLFGCVKRYCSASDGSMWGLTPTFLPRTVVGRTDLLNASAKDGWTLTELLDFAESLPEGVRLSDIPAAAMPHGLLGPNGWNAFLDRDAGTCSFDSAEFRRLLALRKSGEADEVSEYTDYPLYQDGSVILHPVSFTGEWVLLRERMLFGTDELTFVGYPSQNGSGIEMARTLCYIIPSNCPHPDEAWDFLCALLSAGVDHNSTDGFSAKKSLFDIEAQQFSRNEYRIYYDGSSSSGPYRVKSDPASLDKPGVIDYYEAEDAAFLRSLFDSVGTPASNAVPEEIAAIIAEELSAYDAGASSLDDCARIIQSRVSIWLSEHR